MRTTAFFTGLCSALLTVAQGPLTLSLQQAMDLAAQQSYAVQSSVLEARKGQGAHQ
jgi:hypothetical protein